MAIEYPADVKKQMIADIQSYWLDEVGEEIGLLKAELMYRFFNELVGKHAFNMGVAKSTNYLRERMEDLEIDVQLP